MVIARDGPNGPEAIGALPSHINEATAMRNSGTKSSPLFGTSSGARRQMLS